MSNLTDRHAGSLILKDLALFDRAAQYLNLQITPEVGRQLAREIRDWTEGKDWAHGLSDSDFWGEEIWICPKSWHLAEEEWLAWFDLDNRDSEVGNSSLIANAFGVGETQFGFTFHVSHSHFGGKANWNRFAKSLGDEVAALANHGWQHQGAGKFFLPVTLGIEAAVSAWESGDWTDVLMPLTEAMDRISQSLDIFERIVKNGHAFQK